ncbi:MAG: RmuC-domain protein [Pseudonocardiales bacterium]|nr:RmuC-domain protein [Pseudonocardiales bacterium]
MTSSALLGLIAVGCIALLLGAVIGTLSARGRSAARTAEHSVALASARASMDGLLRERDAIAAERDALRTEHARLIERVQGAVADAARLESTLTAERASAVDRAALLAQTQEQVREAFGTLSAEALNRNNEAFVQLAEARLAQARSVADGDLGKRQQAIEAMVTPLRETLTRVQTQLGDVEKDRAGSYATLLEQVTTMRQTSEQLRLETSQLVTALRAPQVRGRWGELQLQRTIEAAGMVEHVDYIDQASSTTDEGTLRPDLLIKLAGGKHVIVDAKVAFAGYLEAMEARDEPTRAARLKAHARHMRVHIDALSAKAYWERFSPSPEFVICFVPADAFLDAALREDPSLQEHAFTHNVVIATPSTLIALLRTIAYTWRQEALAENAAEVHKLGKELYQRLSTMGGHIDKLGRSLGTAVDSYNKTVSTIESRVFVTARKMVELKVVDPSLVLAANSQLGELPRTTSAPELAEQRLVALHPKSPVVPIGQEDLLAAVGDDRLFGTDSQR